MGFARIILVVISAGFVVTWIANPARAMILGPSNLAESSGPSGLPSSWSLFEVKYPISKRFDHGEHDVLRENSPIILADLDPADERVNISILAGDHVRKLYKLRYYRPTENDRRDVVLLEIPFTMFRQKPDGMSIYVPLIRIKDIHQKDKYYTTYMSKKLLDAWVPSSDRSKAARAAVIEGVAELHAAAVLVDNRNQLDVVGRALSELPLGALAELSVTAQGAPSTGNDNIAGTIGSWKLDSKEGNPRAYINSVGADPRGEITLYASCWNGEFRLAMGNQYAGHKYFDFEDFVIGAIDITPVILSFGGADNKFLFWHRPYTDEVRSPGKFLRNWDGFNRGEMLLSGRGDFSIFSTNWDARAVFRKIVSAEHMALKTWGIPRDEYSAWFKPLASLTKLTAHLPCY